jgi:hypothetical protein
MRITINGERFDLGTKRFVRRENWLTDAASVKGSAELARSINSFLNSLRTKSLTIKTNSYWKASNLPHERTQVAVARGLRAEATNADGDLAHHNEQI